MKKFRPALIVAALTPMVALTLAAAPFPDSIPLPDDFAPEGIAVGTGTTFYTGSMWDGDIYRGDLRSGTGSIFADRTGRWALGMKVDARRHLLVVAGGFDGRAAFYDTRDGSLVAEPQLATPPPPDAVTTIVNDVVVTGTAAYFTDSRSPAIYRVPISADGTIGDPETIVVAGPAKPIVGAFQIGLNGIDATPDGRLIVGNTGLGKVFTVDPDTGASTEIAIPGDRLPDEPGDQPVPSNDGILLDGRTLWVVANFLNTVFEVRLSPDLSSGEVVNAITNDDVAGLFRVPTTAAQLGNRLVLVNGRFDQGFPPPFGSGAPEGTDYDVVLVDKR